MKWWTRRPRYLAEYEGYRIYCREHYVLGKWYATYFVQWTDYHLEETFSTKPFRRLRDVFIYIDRRMGGVFLP